MNSIGIQTEELSRSFGSLVAVDRLSLQVPGDSIFGFLGPNGSGKTTTIRLLLGLLAPTSGYARVLGYDIRSAADAIRQSSGALLEHNGLYQRLSAENNLDFYGEVWHMPFFVLFIPLFLLPLLPEAWQLRLAQALARVQGESVVLGVIATLLVVDLALFALASARFQRARLILEE